MGAKRALEKVVKEAGDGEGADTALWWGDGGEVGSLAKLGREVAFNDAFFAGGASVYKNGTRADHIVRN